MESATAIIAEFNRKVMSYAPGQLERWMEGQRPIVTPEPSKVSVPDDNDPLRRYERLARRYRRLDKKYSEKRDFLNEGIKGAMKELKSIQKEVEEHREKLKGLLMTQRIVMDRNVEAVNPDHYPPVPGPFVDAHPDGLGIPPISAIYFLWIGEIVVAYVGQSKNIANRLRLGSHHALRENDKISYIPFPKEQLVWAECYYMSVLRPLRNVTRPQSYCGR